MRMYKRIATVATIFIIMATLNVYAATTGITLKPSVEEVKIGDTVTITIAAKCDSGIEGLESTLIYDKTKLELTTQAGSAALEGYMDISGVDGATEEYRPSVLYTGSGDAPTEADLIILGFKVLNTAEVGETLTIGLTGVEMGDSDNKWEEINELNATLKVVEENDDNNDNNNDNNNTDEENNNNDDNNGDEENNNNNNDNNGDEESNNNDKDNNKNEGTSSNNSTNANKDNTASKNEIPKAGKHSIIIFGIIFGIVLVIAKQKANKYKDI